MKNIRKATIKDVSRLSEILIFSKRINYRDIFNNDKVSFKEMQVLTLVQEYLTDTKKLEDIWVYDDEFVKGLISIENKQIKELYVDPFFVNEGIGAKLIDFSIQKYEVQYLWVLQKNYKAIKFYKAHGFELTKDIRVEQGIEEVKMVR